jgi:hypothetical protein
MRAGGATRGVEGGLGVDNSSVSTSWTPRTCAVLAQSEASNVPPTPAPSCSPPVVDSLGLEAAAADLGLAGIAGGTSNDLCSSTGAGSDGGALLSPSVVALAIAS